MSYSLFLEKSLQKDYPSQALDPKTILKEKSGDLPKSQEPSNSEPTKNGKYYFQKVQTLKN